METSTRVQTPLARLVVVCVHTRYTRSHELERATNNAFHRNPVARRRRDPPRARAKQAPRVMKSKRKRKRAGTAVTCAGRALAADAAALSRLRGLRRRGHVPNDSEGEAAREQAAPGRTYSTWPGAAPLVVSG
jgi:hypothetical protein